MASVSGFLESSFFLTSFPDIMYCILTCLRRSWTDASDAVSDMVFEVMDRWLLPSHYYTEMLDISHKGGGCIQII
ncbi:MAG: hypothetical protein AMDU4_FER2C00207G0002 [Ferroplasma sp. Type II]|nr:MAG: hypothetical protein AMDU4_FER2C00207G0002 [Ferroplasma sp. Type II]